MRETERPGVARRVTRGRMSCIVGKHIRGQKRRFTIGLSGPLTVDQAHTLAATRLAVINLCWLRQQRPTGMVAIGMQLL